MPLVVGVGGAALFGLAIGLRLGGAEAARFALGLPIILLIATLVTTGSMFIAGAFFGLAVPFDAALSLAGRALGDGGLVLAGLTPAAFFLMTTTPDRTGALLWGVVFALVAGFAIARGLQKLVQPGVGRLLAAGWCVVGLGIGARLFMVLASQGQP